MPISTQHHHVTLTSQPDKATETRELLARCALFETQEAVDFHVANVADIVANFGPLMAAPPETIITPVLVSAN